jgi:L-2,4-diaminobutyrate decarboxylase
MTSVLYSGATPQKITKDIQPLLNFQEDGLPLKELQTLVETRLIPHLMQYDTPEFQSMFNTKLEPGAELGACIALQYNQGVTNWQVSPGGVVLEEVLCKKLCELFGFPSTADATFMYSGTYANQEAVYLALHWKAEQEGFDLAEKGLTGFKNPEDLALVTSCDAHFSVKHAVRMLGLGDASIVTVGVDKNRRMDINELKNTLNNSNKNVFCIMVTTGTTSTGSVDPVLPVVDICEDIKAWLHVDGAYGLAYKLVPEWSSLFKGVEKADSVCWDPHKQMGVPIPNSVLFVRRKQDFYRMSVYSSYFNRDEDAEPNPGLKSPPSTRPFSALPLATSLRHQGMKNVIKRLKAPLQAIKTTADTLQGYPDIEVCHTPDTGILCFRVTPEGFPENKLNQLQQFVYNEIMTKGNRTVSMTTLDGVNVLRLVAISPVVTHDALLETVCIAERIAKRFEG